MKIAKETYPQLVETSMPNKDLDMETNVKDLADTHSTRKTKEVIG